MVGLTTNADLNHIFALEAHQEHEVPTTYVAAAKMAGDESARLARHHSARVLFDRTKDVGRWNVRLRHQHAKHVRLRALPPREPETGSIAAVAPSSENSTDAFLILGVQRGRWRPMHGDWIVAIGDEAVALIHDEEQDAAASQLAVLGWEIVLET